MCSNAMFGGFQTFDSPRVAWYDSLVDWMTTRFALSANELKSSDHEP